MKKTQNIFKRFICLILTSILTFGSYVLPVFAAIPDNENPDVQDVIDAYGALKTHKDNIITEINTINSGTPSQAKLDAISEAQEFIDELFGVNGVFKNDQLTVKTTQFNVVDVTIDFTLADLGLTDGALKTQVVGDAYKTIQAYALTADYVVGYLKLSDEYTEKLNTAGYTIEDIESYVEQLNILEIEYNNESYISYTLEFAQLLISTGTPENMTQIDALIDNLNTYYSETVSTLKDSLEQMYTDLNNGLNTNLNIVNIQNRINNALTALGASNPNLIDLADEYTDLVDEYKALEEQYKRQNPDTSYVDSGIETIKESIQEIAEQQITVEQIELIQSMINQPLTAQIKLEDLVSAIDENELFDKLVSGELSYDVLESYVNLHNNFNIIPDVIVTIQDDINSQNNNISQEIKDELNEVLETGITEGVFGETGYYMDLLENQIKNESKTEEERLQILNKLNLVEYSFEVLSGAPFITQMFPSNETLDVAVERISDEIEKLKEFYNKSCDNTLSNLKANDIELDLTKELNKVYVGNDVTKIDLEYLKNNDKSVVEIIGAENLKVGSNEVIVRVTAENGDVREYVLEVVRAEKEVVASTTENKSNEEPKVTPMNNNNDYSDETTNITLEETDNDEISNTSDSNEKYDKELEKENGLNGLTVLLIVIGIALVGFGIYKIFGEKEDKKIERAFNNPQPKKEQINKTHNSNNKKKNKKRK